MNKIFSNLRKLKSQAGFTMIELLIVIAILGILAVAVLSAINPIEQINRGRDTGSRSDAEQLLSAIDRYNAFQGYYPWQTGADDTTGLPLITWAAQQMTAEDIIQDSNTCNMSDKLAAGDGASCVGSDELKVTYFNRIFESGYNHMYIYNRGSQGDSTYICFKPKSKAFKTEAVVRCNDALGSGLPADLASIGSTICEDYADPNAADANIFVCLP